MRALFLNPPFLPGHGRFSREQRSPGITRSGTFYYPMWLSYAAGYLEARGHDVLLLDAPARRASWEEIAPGVEKFEPGLAVVATSTPSIYSDVSHAEAIKNLFPNAFIILVGVHVSALPAETLELNDAVDAVVVGEYELTLAEVARRLECRLEMKGVPGLVFRNRDDNSPVFNEPAKFNGDLDSIPWVTKTYRKHLHYRDYFYSGNLYPVVSIVTSRGCPNSCVFCAYPQTVTGRAHRTRSIEDVINEMKYIVREFSPLGEIMFEDDTFTANEERTVRFAESVLERGLKVRWSCNARADLKAGTMKLMHRAGCRSLLVGFESGVQSILDGMRKGTTLSRHRQFMTDSKKAGLLINGAFLFGMPGETRETMLQTLGAARLLNPDVAQFFPVMVYPGTRIYEWYKPQGFIRSNDFRDYLTEEGLHNCIVNLPGLSGKELVQFCDYCRRAFYLRPRYLISKAIQAVTDPREGIRTLKAARTFARHLLFGTKV